MNLRIYIHDYAGHISQVEVARALTSRGHHVTFTYCDGLATPRGDLTGSPGVSLAIRPISVGGPINKRNYLVRQWQDILYRRALLRDLRRTPCDVVLSCNTPLAPQAGLVGHCRRYGIPVIHWWSEVYSHAVYDGLRRKSKALATVVGGAYQRVEKKLLEESNAVISVFHGAAEVAQKWKSDKHISVIPVAAPLEKIRPVAKDNGWSRQHGLDKTLNILYSGTLGIKHHPEFLSQLATALQSRHDIRVVVASEGPGADQLRSAKSELGLDNLLLLPFQPFEDYVNVLGAADMQVTILGEDASKYSLPSKFASQLCSGRPQIAVVPPDNDAARMIKAAQAGLISGPDDYDSFEQNVRSLVADETARFAMGSNGRKYVEHSLDIDGLIERYQDVIRDLLVLSDSEPTHAKRPQTSAA